MNRNGKRQGGKEEKKGKQLGRKKRVEGLGVYGDLQKTKMVVHPQRHSSSQEKHLKLRRNWRQSLENVRLKVRLNE